MNSKNRYLVYLVYLLLTIPTVIIVFKFIEPKKLASLFAATLFISCSLLIIFGEIKYKTTRTISIVTSLVFLVFFSAPMMIGRIVNYDKDFSEINFGPVSGPEFHKYSNYGFMILVASIILDILKSKWPRSAAISKKN